MAIPKLNTNYEQKSKLPAATQIFDSQQTARRFRALLRAVAGLRSAFAKVPQHR